MADSNAAMTARSERLVAAFEQHWGELFHALAHKLGLCRAYAHYRWISHPIQLFENATRSFDEERVA